MGSGAMLKPTFSQLDKNYNTNSKYIHTCTMSFKNTSAIRMCEALVKTDIRFLDEFKISTKNKCPHGYIIGAADLAYLLSQPQLLGVRSYNWNSQSNGNAPKEALGKHGIICYMDIPGYAGQGHIDLWNNNSPVGDEFWEAKSIWMWTLI